MLFFATLSQLIFELAELKSFYNYFARFLHVGNNMQSFLSVLHAYTIKVVMKSLPIPLIAGRVFHVDGTVNDGVKQIREDTVKNFVGFSCGVREGVPSVRTEFLVIGYVSIFVWV